jgi:hypothetical protein
VYTRWHGVRLDLVVGGVRQDHQRDLLGHLGQSLWHVGMRVPGGHRVVVGLAVGVEVLDLPLLAQAANGVLEHDLVGLPVAQHLVETVGGKVGDELLHLLGRDAVGKQLARQLAHAEARERAVAIEGDVLGAEGHGLGSSGP